MFCRVTGASENTHLPDAVFGDLAPEERKRIVWDKKTYTFCLSPPGADQDWIDRGQTGSQHALCLSVQGSYLATARFHDKRGNCNECGLLHEQGR
jgi:hypothetical protein